MSTKKAVENPQDKHFSPELSTNVTRGGNNVEETDPGKVEEHKEPAPGPAPEVPAREEVVKKKPKHPVTEE